MVEEWLLLTGPTRTRMGVSYSEAVRPSAGNKRCVREGFCPMSDWVNDDKNLFPLYRPWNIVESKRDFFFLSFREYFDFHWNSSQWCWPWLLYMGDKYLFCRPSSYRWGVMDFLLSFLCILFLSFLLPFNINILGISLIYFLFLSFLCVCVQVLWDPSRALRHISQQWTWTLHKRWLPWATTRAVCVSTATRVSGQGWVPDEMQYL